MPIRHANMAMSLGQNTLAICCASTSKIPTSMPKRWAKATSSAMLVWGVSPMPPDYMFPIGYSSRDRKYLALRERIRAIPSGSVVSMPRL